MCFKNKQLGNLLVNYKNGDSKNMKKVNSKIVVVAFVLLTLLAGGFAAKQAIAGGNGGVGVNPNPDPI
jgi:hypothetical protein